MPKRAVAPVRTPRLTLRLLEPADLPTTLAWRNRDDVRRWFTHSAPLTAEGHAAWFAQYAERDNDFLFLVSEADRPVGQVGLYGIDWAAGSAEFGRLMIGDEGAAGRGLAREATQAMLDFGFGELGLTRIVLEVLDDNDRAIALYRRVGFRDVRRADGLTFMEITAPEARHGPADGMADEPGTPR